MWLSGSGDGDGDCDDGGGGDGEYGVRLAPHQCLGRLQATVWSMWLNDKDRDREKHTLIERDRRGSERDRERE